MLTNDENVGSFWCRACSKWYENVPWWPLLPLPDFDNENQVLSEAEIAQSGER